MKNNTFIVLFIIEFLAALVMMGLMFSDMGVVIYLVNSVVFIAILFPFFIQLKNSSDEVEKRKIRHKILLLLLIPTFVGLSIVTFVVANLFMYFGI